MKQREMLVCSFHAVDKLKVTRMTQVCLHIPQFDCHSKIVEAISHPEVQLKKNISYGIQVGVQNDS